MKTWVTVLQSCQHWLLTCFLGTFQISVKGRLVYGFLREAYCTTETRNPTQTLAAQAAVAHSSLFPLFILIYLEILSWTCIPDLLGGGAGRRKDGDFFFPWNNGFKCKIRGQGRRQEGRRLQPLRPPHFPVQESQHFPWSIASYKTLLFLVWTWIYRRLEFRCLFRSHFSLTPFFFPSIK